MSFTPLNKYLSEYLTLKCCPDLSGSGIWPNSKEITESMGAFEAVRKHVLPGETYIDRDKNFGRDDIVIVSVGDGSTPRTAALFACRSRWDCYSIDPNLRSEKTWPFKRLTLLKRKVEDKQLSFYDTQYTTCIIVMVHSHASIHNTLSHIKAPIRHLVSIPCCVPHVINDRPYIGYTDSNIASPKNEVKIWLNV